MEDIFHPVSSFKVTPDYSGVRLDNCLISLMKGLPRTKIYSIIRKGEVRVNKSRAKPRQKLVVGDIIRMPPYRVSTKNSVFTTQKDKEKIAQSILIKEKDFLIINKPVGIASHGGSGISSGVIEIVRSIDPIFKNAQLAHRIDRDTSGCLVIALRKSFLRKLHSEIRNKQVDKIYDLIAFGDWPEDLNLIDEPLSKKQSISREKEAFVEQKGKRSITEFKLIKKHKGLSHLKARIITGRMHQIRAHAKFKGFPIVGDRKYGDALLNKGVKNVNLNRMLLHATSIRFKNLDIECSAELPKIFFNIMS